MQQQEWELRGTGLPGACVWGKRGEEWPGWAREARGKAAAAATPSSSSAPPCPLHPGLGTPSVSLALSDRPQVQCVRTYKALQPDELTLEKTDILAVRTRTSDGERASREGSPMALSRAGGS